jgi:hypothetical protein
MPNDPQNQASKELPSTDIFANLIGGEELHVPDWPIYDHIITHCKSIKGLAEYLIYVRFILERSAGHINRPQWHNRITILQLLKMKTDNLSRYESQWIDDGWLLKHEGGGRESSHRALGRQFNHIRLQYGGGQNCPAGRTGNQIQIGSSTPPQVEGSTPPQVEGSTPPQVEGSTPPQVEGTNPNNPNPNQVKPNDLNGGGITRARAYDRTNGLGRKDPPPPFEGVQDSVPENSVLQTQIQNSPVENSPVQKRTVQFSLSEREAGDIFDTLRARQKLGNIKREYAKDIPGWRKIFQKVWNGIPKEQIEAEVDLLSRLRGSIPKDAKAIRRAILELQALSLDDTPRAKTPDELKAEFEAQQEYIAERGSLDDIPF